MEEYKHNVASINTVVEGVPQSFVAMRLLSYRLHQPLFFCPCLCLFLFVSFVVSFVRLARKIDFVQNKHLKIAYFGGHKSGYLALEG